jgi:hypothetical protein
MAKEGRSVLVDQLAHRRVDLGIESWPLSRTCQRERGVAERHPEHAFLLALGDVSGRCLSPTIGGDEIPIPSPPVDLVEAALDDRLPEPLPDHLRGWLVRWRLLADPRWIV